MEGDYNKNIWQTLLAGRAGNRNIAGGKCTSSRTVLVRCDMGFTFTKFALTDGYVLLITRCLALLDLENGLWLIRFAKFLPK